MKTMLKVTSIIYIVLGGLGIAGGIILTISLAAIGSYSSGSMNGVSHASILTALGAGLGIFIIVGAVISLLTGIFGVKGCGGNRGTLTAGLVFVIIGLVFSLIGTIIAITNDLFSFSSIFGYALPVLYLVSGINVRKEL